MSRVAAAGQCTVIVVVPPPSGCCCRSTTSVHGSRRPPHRWLNAVKSARWHARYCRSVTVAGSEVVMLPSALSVLLEVALTVNHAAFGVGGGRRDRDCTVLQAGSDSPWSHKCRPFATTAVVVVTLWPLASAKPPGSPCRQPPHRWWCRRSAWRVHCRPSIAGRQRGGDAAVRVVEYWWQSASDRTALGIRRRWRSR